MNKEEIKSMLGTEVLCDDEGYAYVEIDGQRFYLLKHVYDSPKMIEIHPCTIPESFLKGDQNG